MRQLVVTVPAEFEDQVIEALQGECQLTNITRFSDGTASKISCYVAAQETGVVLHELDKVGCGAAYGKVALLPVLLLKPLPNLRDRHLTVLVKERTWRLQGRMATEEIYTSIASGTELSFDYLAFIVVAGLIACVGLATNSSVMIVASMLVSPLMGPILAFSFGTSVQDTYLIWKGVVGEAVGVALTFLVGLVIGFAACIWTGVSHYYNWPTDEMLSRGQVSGLVTGVFFALPSGAGVALSTTQGGTNALVGVAIAASLLPPVANCGMNLAFAIAGASRCGLSAHLFFRISWMSLALFGINVGCIYVVCLIFFRIKDIKKVRKQLSRYRDLPPVRSRGADRDSSAGAKVLYGTTAGGMQHRGVGPGADASVASSSAGGGGGPGEVAIKIRRDSTQSTGTPHRPQRGQSPPGSRVSSNASNGVGGRLSGMLGSILKGSSPASTPTGSVRGDAQGAASGPSLKGWGRVRKVVMEDGTLHEIVEAAEGEPGEVELGEQGNASEQESKV